MSASTAGPDVAQRVRRARLFWRTARHAVVATHSTRHAGFPYGSAVAIAPDANGGTLLLISELAAHSRDLRADPRASLTVHGLDAIAGARLTLLGQAAPIDSADAIAAAKARYLACVPDAADFVDFGDFHLWRFLPEAGHWIGGFGDILWFDAAAFVVDAPDLEAASPGIVEHMNADHAHNLRDYVLALHGQEAVDVRMLAIDPDGIDLDADGVARRVDFGAPAFDAQQARAALVALAQRARAEAAGSAP
jgi:heme iron utilization protein